jgi:hypothetical protein
MTKMTNSYGNLRGRCDHIVAATFELHVIFEGLGEISPIKCIS